ncbi:hypothetical protein COT63_02575 [Candidatus Shapirobacteria bacterium CG09_land_8_20_14_0_10_38_17]|uniref:Glycosyltransferase 2-like domain-containing protein n=1 Tax=Candidatus Shapirobacteria bacterium CG09_land_8_20_14_0_10_38_17 TaxID=1974884 RepID=A0A2H0WQQ5_9BACT|nr:MAG: hypothetical protein COT63_02575 [Candidatus Shapirobacteria bacterium CG09_land_8_20_14_0_10_38_17]
MPPKLSVVVCTFNRGKSLKKCLKSLCQQTFSNFEVVIVDGGSQDNTNQVVNRFSQKLKIRLFVDRRPELSQVRDRGWREARGQYVAWIDDDVIASLYWAQEIINTLNDSTHKNIAGVSGPTIINQKLLANRDVFSFYHARGIKKILGEFWNWFFLEGGKFAVGQITKCGAWTPGSNFSQSLKIRKLQDVDYLEACNMTLRRNLIEKVGGFDYGYTGVGEWSELDLAIRVKKLGYRLVFNPKARVNHDISREGVFKRRTHSRQRMENFFRFYFRHIFKFRLDYIFKFSCYLLFLNSYWGYKAISTQNINWLGGWVGTATGFLKVLEKNYENRR